MYIAAAPSVAELLAKVDAETISQSLNAAQDPRLSDRYMHWDKLRHLDPPEGIGSDEWWLRIKISRLAEMRPLPLVGSRGGVFSYGLPDLVLKRLHRIDQRCSGEVVMDEVV